MQVCWQFVGLSEFNYEYKNYYSPGDNSSKFLPPNMYLDASWMPLSPFVTLNGFGWFGYENFWLPID